LTTTVFYKAGVAFKTNAKNRWNIEHFAAIAGFFLCPILYLHWSTNPWIYIPTVIVSLKHTSGTKKISSSFF
jgi:hypothetical protein